MPDAPDQHTSEGDALPRQGSDPEHSDRAESPTDEVVDEGSVAISSLEISPARRFSNRSVLVEIVRADVVRALVALLLIALLAYVVIAAFSRTKTWEDTKELLDVVLPAVTALLGSAIGFYFGAKTT